MHLLRFKIPGLHSEKGYKYSYNEDDDDEVFDYPPVALALGSGGRLDVAYVVNAEWKRLNLLKDIKKVP